MKKELQDYEKRNLLKLRGELAGCTVLLKSNGDFPLVRAGKLALYGNAARNTVKGGTGSGEVNSHFFVTAERGLERAGFRITTKRWLDEYDDVRKTAHERFVKELNAKALAHHTIAAIESMGAVMPEPEYDLRLEGEGDTAVYVLGRISGEGSDRTTAPGDIALTQTEIRDILALQKKYPRFMLVLNTCGPVDLCPVAAVQNILVLSLLGVETGRALARILLGEDTPSGKLTTTWAAPEDYPSWTEFGGHDDTYYREGIYVGYRYFDTVGKKPMFPFGFGLSYTRFSVGPAEVFTEDGEIRVRAGVKNTGKRKGREVLQLYASVPAGRLDQPKQMLAAFAKTRELKPGEEEVLLLRAPLADLAGYDTEKEAYILEAGDYLLHIGTSSADTTVCGVIRLDGEAVVRKVHNICPDAPKDRGIEACGEATAVPAGAPVIEMAAADVLTETVNYNRAEKIEAEAESFTNEELALMNVGAFREKKTISSAIGDAAFSVAGAAGETTMKLRVRGIPSLSMADGPAGLRLAKHAVRNEAGVRPLESGLPESMLELLPAPLRALSRLTEKRPQKKGEIFHQYATAIPIGTAIAQSWDVHFAELCGDIVGDEMSRFGVHLWLAPALNIHRDIRCGRNFEYFSEDPLVSGLFAAAVTKGVQKHPGCGVTIKHFAANNQEYNRYSNNSHVSERALREIYLRGFGICVRAAQPASVMTSYNLLNGTHTSELRTLTEDILRCEYGFKGIVMTDWIIRSTIDKTSLYPEPAADRIAAAGNDVVMPGSPRDYDEILAALEDGSLPRRTAQENASRMLRMIRMLYGKHETE